MESFFTDNDSFIVVPQHVPKKPSQIMSEQQYDYSSSDDDGNNIIEVSRRRPSFIKNSLKSFKKRVATIPAEPNTVLPPKKRSWFCCF
jgi:hypothetical protein